MNRYPSRYRSTDIVRSYKKVLAKSKINRPLINGTEPVMERRKSLRKIKPMKHESALEGCFPITLEDLEKIVQSFYIKFNTHMNECDRTTVDKDEALAMGIQLRTFSKILRNEKISDNRYYPEESLNSINEALARIREVRNVIVKYTNSERKDQKISSSDDEASEFSDSDSERSKFIFDQSNVQIGDHKRPRSKKKPPSCTLVKNGFSKVSQNSRTPQTGHENSTDNSNHSPAVQRASKKFKKSVVAAVESSDSVQLKPKKSVSKRKVKSSRIDQVESSNVNSTALSFSKFVSNEEISKQDEESPTDSKLHYQDLYSDAQRVTGLPFFNNPSLQRPKFALPDNPAGLAVQFASNQSEEIFDSSDIIPPTVDNSQSYTCQPLGASAIRIPQNSQNTPFSMQIPKKAQKNDDLLYSINCSTFHLQQPTATSSKEKPSVKWNQNVESNSQGGFCDEGSVLHTLNEAFTLGTSISNDLASSSNNVLNPTQECSPLLKPASSNQPFQAKRNAIDATITPTFDTELAAPSQSYTSIGIPQSLDIIAESRKGRQVPKRKTMILLAPSSQSKSERRPPGQPKQSARTKKSNRSSNLNSQPLPTHKEVFQKRADLFKIPSGSYKIKNQLGAPFTSEAGNSSFQPTAVSSIKAMAGVITNVPSQLADGYDSESIHQKFNQLHNSRLDSDEQHAIPSPTIWQSQPCGSNHRQENQQPSSSAETVLNGDCHPSVGFGEDSYSSLVIEGTPQQNMKCASMNITAVPSVKLHGQRIRSPVPQQHLQCPQSNNGSYYGTPSVYQGDQQPKRYSNVPMRESNAFNASSQCLSDNRLNADHPRIGHPVTQNEPYPHQNKFHQSHGARQEIDYLHQLTSISCIQLATPTGHLCNPGLPANPSGCVRSDSNINRTRPEVQQSNSSRQCVDDNLQFTSNRPTAVQNIQHSNLMIPPAQMSHCDTESAFTISDHLVPQDYSVHMNINNHALPFRLAVQGSQTYRESYNASCENSAPAEEQTSDGKGFRRENAPHHSSTKGRKTSKSTPKSQKTVKTKKKKTNNQKSSQTHLQNQVQSSIVGECAPGEKSDAFCIPSSGLNTQSDLHVDTRNLPGQSMQERKDELMYQKPQTFRPSSSQKKPEEIHHQSNPSGSINSQQRSATAQKTSNNRAKQPGMVCGVSSSPAIHHTAGQIHSKMMSACETIPKPGVDLNGNYHTAGLPGHRMPTNADLRQHPCLPQQSGDSGYLQNTWMSHNWPQVDNSPEETVKVAHPEPSSSSDMPTVKGSCVIGNIGNMHGSKYCAAAQDPNVGRRTGIRSSIGNNTKGDDRPDIRNAFERNTSEKYDHWKHVLEKAKRNPYIHELEEYVFPASPDKVQSVVDWIMKKATKANAEN